MSEWDKLWKEIGAVESISSISHMSNSWVRNILIRVKAEGDKLNEFHSSWIFLTDPERLKEIRENEQKLEAVKQVVDEWGRQRDDDYGLEYDWYYKDKYYKLEKILEAEG